MPIPNRLDIIRLAKHEVINSGIDPDKDECARFEITKLAAFKLSKEYPEVGLLSKPVGNNCEGYAVDIICLIDGTIIDVLGSGNEGPNTPLWLEQAPVPPSRWRPPIPIIEKPIPPEPLKFELPEIKIDKMKALSIIMMAIGALVWLYKIISKSNAT
jgi:hypothetical protein